MGRDNRHAALRQMHAEQCRPAARRLRCPAPQPVRRESRAGAAPAPTAPGRCVDAGPSTARAPARRAVARATIEQSAAPIASLVALPACRLASEARFSSAVSSSFNAAAWPMYVTAARKSGSSGATGTPRHDNVPWAACDRPAAMRSKRRLAAAIGAGHQQGVAGPEREIDAREQRRGAALRGQLLRFQHRTCAAEGRGRL